MTQTSRQSSEKLSSRQRRIEEQRRKIEAARGQEGRNRMVWGAGIVVVVAAALAAVLLLLPRGSTASASMRQVVTESASHVDEGAPLSYRNRPPSSGMHYGTLPQPQEYRMWDTPLTPGPWLPMLEHRPSPVPYP